ncbi:N-acetylglucosamine-6-phosphate deacetylase [bacterium]|nr:N-acetylglucosamine-6-phosphate deacetylase [bacterium]
MKLEGRVLCPDGKLREGALLVEDGLVRSFREGKAARAGFVLPGFVDVHVHGGGGHDTMDGEAGALGLARFHARRGTTSLCPTTITSEPGELERALRGIGLAASSDHRGRARILGAHLEGPFISERRLGAQPSRARAPDRELLARLLDSGPVAIATLAPELAGALELVDELVRRGVRASLGHSDADHATARAAYARGARGATHLWNAMSGANHRSPGLAVAALEEKDAFLELILDLHHVHPAVLELTLRAARGRVVLVTDAIRATGKGDGESELGGQRVFVQAGRAALADGTLAGSVLTLDRALGNAVANGVSLERASELLSRNPADYLGKSDLGRFEPGARGDAVLLGDDLSVERVLVGGDEVSLA